MLAQPAPVSATGTQLNAPPSPLTALRTEIELALLEPHEAAQEPLLQRLKNSVDRSARLAQQMLSMARSDASPPHEGQRVLDLRDLAALAAEDWVPRALNAGIDLGYWVMMDEFHAEAIGVQRLPGWPSEAETGIFSAIRPTTDLSRKKLCPKSRRA